MAPFSFWGFFLVIFLHGMGSIWRGRWHLQDTYWLRTYIVWDKGHGIAGWHPFVSLLFLRRFSAHSQHKHDTTIAYIHMRWRRRNGEKRLPSSTLFSFHLYNIPFRSSPFLFLYFYFCFFSVRLFSHLFFFSFVSVLLVLFFWHIIHILHYIIFVLFTLLFSSTADG